jgi:hypothetical protein
MTDFRDIAIDELFSWRENLGFNSRTLLGNRGYVNQKTYDEIKRRCDHVEQVKSWLDTFRHFTELEINVNESVPDGMIRPRKLVQSS